MEERTLRAIFLSAIRTVSAGAVLASCSTPEPPKLSPVNDASTSTGAALVVAPPTEPLSEPTGLADTPMDCSQRPPRFTLPDNTTPDLDYLEITYNRWDAVGFGTLCGNVQSKPLCEEEHKELKEALDDEQQSQRRDRPDLRMSERVIIEAQGKLSTIKFSDLDRRFVKIASASEAALYAAIAWQSKKLDDDFQPECPVKFGVTSAGYILHYVRENKASNGFEEILVTFDGKLQILAFNLGVGGFGRRPSGLCAPARRAPQSAGEFFAEAAWLEAVSVPAFHTLARDLTLLNAPSPLIEAALVAAQDERRHEQQMTALAQLEGAQVIVPVVEDTPPKDLFALALENEREGCVNETFAALLAWHQAAHAQEPKVAREMKEIAVDETSHAALSFQVRQWLLPQLTPAQQEATRQVRQQTIAALRVNPPTLPPETAQRLGWPSRQQSLALLAHLSENLWS